MHRDRQLARVRERLSANFHVPVVQHDVVGVEGALVGGVGVRSEDQSALDYDGVQDWGAVDVDEELETCGD